MSSPCLRRTSDTVRLCLKNDVRRTYSSSTSMDGHLGFTRKQAQVLLCSHLNVAIVWKGDRTFAAHTHTPISSSKPVTPRRYSLVSTESSSGDRLTSICFSMFFRSGASLREPGWCDVCLLFSYRGRSRSRVSVFARDYTLLVALLSTLLLPPPRPRELFPCGRGAGGAAVRYRTISAHLRSAKRE